MGINPGLGFTLSTAELRELAGVGRAYGDGLSPACAGQVIDRLDAAEQEGARLRAEVERLKSELADALAMARGNLADEEAAQRDLETLRARAATAIALEEAAIAYREWCENVRDGCRACAGAPLVCDEHALRYAELSAVEETALDASRSAKAGRDGCDWGWLSVKETP